MQYSPKLKKAMEQIKSILNKNDIAGFVLLHDEAGFSEYINHVNTSYSALNYDNGELRVRIKTAEVGKEKAKRMAEGTYNMVTHFEDMICRHAVIYMDLKKILKDKWGGEDFDGNHTSHDQQNN